MTTEHSVTYGIWSVAAQMWRALPDGVLFATTSRGLAEAQRMVWQQLSGVELRLYVIGDDGKPEELRPHA
jgi:hypothetical protein